MVINKIQVSGIKKINELFIRNLHITNESPCVVSEISVDIKIISNHIELKIELKIEISLKQNEKSVFRNKLQLSFNKDIFTREPQFSIHTEHPKHL